jgi:hypothetical protein
MIDAELLPEYMLCMLSVVAILGLDYWVGILCKRKLKKSGLTYFNDVGYSRPGMGLVFLLLLIWCWVFSKK